MGPAGVRLGGRQRWQHCVGVVGVSGLGSEKGTSGVRGSMM